MPDRFENYAAGLDSPAFEAAAVTPHDANDLAFVARGIYVGTGGDVALIPKGNAAGVIFRNVQSGTLLPVTAKRVLAAGTTASQILALW
jgi:hypothetical protein